MKNSETLLPVTPNLQEITEAENTRKLAESTEKTRRQSFWAKIIISLIIISAVIIYRVNKIEIKWEEILLFVLAVIPWFSSFTETFKVGKDGIEIKYLEEKLDKLQTEVKTEIKPLAQEAKELAVANEDRVSDVREIATTAQVAALRGVGKKPVIEQPEFGRASDHSEKTFFNADDPQKGQWGGKTVDEETNRRISARVEKISGEDYFRRIIVRVESTDPVNNPLTGKVTFHLHPTFDEPVINVRVIRGIAETKLVAYGAFTIGAEADEGKTKLELDLTKELDDGKDPFFKR